MIILIKFGFNWPSSFSKGKNTKHLQTQTTKEAVITICHMIL
jgi:hypothetical protein